MSRDTIIPLEELNLEQTLFDKDAIRKKIPQRFEMEMIDRIVHYDPARMLIAGVKTVREDEFWVRGHFPGRPLLPGVLMLEAVGQLCSFQYVTETKRKGILGFGAANNVKFRGTVEPPSDLLILGEMIEAKPRTARFRAQGLVSGKKVFEAEILGIVL